MTPLRRLARRRRRLRLAELIDLECQLVADEALSEDELRHRDRTIGREIERLRDDRRVLFLAWLQRLRASEHSLPGDRAVQALRIATVLLGVLGFAAGSGTAAGLFAYDGTHPVNVVHILAVFVGFQLLLLLLWSIAALPSRWLAYVPGASAMQESIRLLSPGRWVPLLARVLPAQYRSALAAAWGRLHVFERLYGSVRLWTIVRVAQAFSVAFNLGAVTGAFALVAFTDLAFAWSTTLEIGANGFHHLTAILAAPWSWLLPQATPSAELIESTRYFRLNASYAGADIRWRALDVATTGEWWRFLIACMVFYGLLPRLLTAATARWRLRAALARVRLDHAGYERLYERLIESLVETRSPEPETAAARSAGDEHGAAAPLGPLSGPVAVINWANVVLGEESTRRLLAAEFGCDVSEVMSAGGLDVDADDRVLERVGRDGRSPVWVVVKSYEAPTRDLEHFLGALRERAGDGRAIVLLPIDAGDGGRWQPPEEEDVRVWEHCVRALGDPWLRIETPERPK